MNISETPRFQLLLALAFLAVVMGATIDLVLDRPDRWLSAHVLVEVTLALVSLGLSLVLWARWIAASRDLKSLRFTLEARREERDRWKESAQRALQGLGRAVDEQFRQWELTATEREVALHLLKGHSHKRTARLTHRSERTVRQHAVSIYRKSGLGGRAELSAFFLEDLILPDNDGTSLPGAP